MRADAFMTGFRNSDGGRILPALVKAIRDHKQSLSDIDGAIGDGDHGINMNKGFMIFSERFAASPGNLSRGLDMLSMTLMTKIGGAMGPLYGFFFKGMAAACRNAETINAAVFGNMLSSCRDAIGKISQAKVGDKTLVDVLVPAEEAYRSACIDGKTFVGCLDAMISAAVQGRDATKEMMAKVGRASRLGERSRGIVDAGAASCCLILETMAQSIKAILR
ncbi:MAG: dihydroxyacetone kinase subunit DhaL [Candidatus Aminicenantales bacterium]|jgi:dihydroxyacetone kinase-like protein